MLFVLVGDSSLCNCCGKEIPGFFFFFGFFFFGFFSGSVFFA